MMNRNTIALGTAALLAAAAALPLAAAAQDAETATVGVSQKQPFGDYLVDGAGKSLYMLEKDKQGTGGTGAESVCFDKCVKEWPLLTAEGEPQAGDQIDASKLSTIERKDGKTQVTYNGWPLYYYHSDKQRGDTAGQDKHDEWGGWYLLSPSGEKIDKH